MLFFPFKLHLYLTIAKITVHNVMNEMKNPKNPIKIKNKNMNKNMNPIPVQYSSSSIL